MFYGEQDRRVQGQWSVKEDALLKGSIFFVSGASKVGG